MIEEHDKQHGYCPRLGHHLHFNYCRAEKDGTPCSKIYDCWFEKFDIQSYMQQNFAEIDRARQAATAPNKMFILLDLIKKAQTRQQEKAEV